MSQKEGFVPAMGKGMQWATPIYQTVVDVFCRDTHVKNVLLRSVQGRDLVVVDIACGTGKLLGLLAEQQPCCAITGLDIDPEMIRRAREKAVSYPNVSIQLADCTKHLPFDDASVDVVIESLLFHHLSDDAKVLATQEIARVLRPQSGRFFFVDWIAPSTIFAKVAFKVIKVIDGEANVAAHESGRVLDLIEQHSSLRRIVDASTTVQTSFGTLGIIPFELQ